MKRFSKLIVTGLTLLLVQFACADESNALLAESSTSKNTKSAPSSCGQTPCPPVCFEQGYPNTKCCFPSAYNEPANYVLAPSAWDLWIDASFTYWEAQQDGMDLAISTNLTTAPFLQSPTDGEFLFQDNSYKPGFRIGLGMDLGHDNWGAFADYTWFRSKTSTNRAAPFDSRPGTDVWAVTDWVRVPTNTEGTFTFSSLASTWHLNMDLLDVGILRPYYQGTHLIVAPFGGIRAQWIRQKLTLSGPTVPIGEVDVGTFATANNKSDSWAVGPRAGFNGKWHLAWGFRFEGDVAASLLFTQYTKVSTNISPTVAGGTGQVIAIHLTDHNCSRVVNEMNLGIGWGSYFGCRKYHFDFLATYDFQVFWNQNMMRALVDGMGAVTSGNVASQASAVGASPANLYLQGLTVNAQFDF